jgi:hypothetical protein
LSSFFSILRPKTSNLPGQPRICFLPDKIGSYKENWTEDDVAQHWFQNRQIQRATRSTQVTAKTIRHSSLPQDTRIVQSHTSPTVIDTDCVPCVNRFRYHTRLGQSQACNSHNDCSWIAGVFQVDNTNTWN